jgi:hypothetical protein
MDCGQEAADASCSRSRACPSRVRRCERKVKMNVTITPTRATNTPTAVEMLPTAGQSTGPATCITQKNVPVTSVISQEHGAGLAAAVATRQLDTPGKERRDHRGAERGRAAGEPAEAGQ